MRLTRFSESIFDEIFADGQFTERRIEQAGVMVMYLAQQHQPEARKARRVLGEMLLFAIADQRCSDPQRCAARYYNVMSAALGEPHFSDPVELPPRLDRQRRA